MADVPPRETSLIYDEREETSASRRLYHLLTILNGLQQIHHQNPKKLVLCKSGSKPDLTKGNWFQLGLDKAESVPNRIGAGLDRKTTFRNGKPIIRTGLERIMRVHVGICRLYTQSAEAELDFSMISKELVFRFPGTNFS